MFSHKLKYFHEFTHKLRIAVVGCGGQAFRNIFPVFNYAPVELVATCDQDGERAQAFAQHFGAQRNYSSYTEMLEKEQLDTIFLATGYDSDCKPLYPTQAAQAMQAGCHVWIEKPPASSTREITDMYEAAQKYQRQVGVGFMKMFSPSASKVREIIRQPEFAPVTTLSLRDPELFTAEADRNDPCKLIYLLDHIVHPASLIYSLLGAVQRIYAEREPHGGAVLSLKFVSGACGVLHMPWGQSSTSPMERLEVVGRGANVVVENGTRVTYYRPGHRGLGEYEYGRIGSFTTSFDQAPSVWELDHYSGQPYNMHIFYQGYAQEILYFCNCLLNEEALKMGNLSDAWNVIHFYEKLLQVRDGQVIEFDTAPDWVKQSVPDVIV